MAKRPWESVILKGLRGARFEWRRLADLAFFAGLPLLALLYVERRVFLPSTSAFDLRVFLEAGKAVLNGHSPYPAPSTIDATHVRNYFVYPAPVALAMVPFAALPFALAAVLFSLLMIVCILVALRILGVVDWRCYGAPFLWFPTLLAIKLGTITPLLVLGLALLWRFRDRRLIAASSLAGVVVAKLFLWPLLVWLVATRRFLTALAAAVGATLISVTAWAFIGFAGFGEYPHLLNKLARVEEGLTFSVTAFGESLGFSPQVARLVTLVVGGSLVVGTFALARARDGDRISFLAAVAAGIVLSPIVWLHYFAILLVPVAMTDAWLTPLWLLPIGLWVLRTDRGYNSYTSFHSTWRISVPLILTAAILLAGAARSRRWMGRL